MSSLKGWTPVVESISSSSSDFHHVVVKEVLGRDIYVQDGNDYQFLLVLLDPLSSISSASPWLTLRGARKLLCPGVRLLVTGKVVSILPVVANEDADADKGSAITAGDDTKDAPLNRKKKKKQQLVANSLVITAALPASPYIARLLSCPVGTLLALFSSNNIDNDDDKTSVAAPPIASLAAVLRPCSLEQCQQLYDICQTAKCNGQSHMACLFKHADILQLAENMLLFQADSWLRPVRSAPVTSRQSWEALRRMERTWCRASDGTIDMDILTVTGSDCNPPNNTNCTPEQHSTTRTMLSDRDRFQHVDPLLNLPDPTDERRVKYIEERKKPQIQCMLALIQRTLTKLTTVHKTKTDAHRTQTLQLVDVGGGRGDLAMAVAAYFANHDDDHDQDESSSNPDKSAHITVIDINPTSLEAGKDRAAAAGLSSYMSFVLCDLSDSQQIQDLTSTRTFDLVFGLHCCGGLAEAAVELALTSQASFCVSTCCFRSNEKLASLSCLSEEILSLSSKHDDDTTHTTTTLQEKEQQIHQHRQDRNLVTCLATMDHGQGQHCAIRAINAMRLVAAEERVRVYQNTGEKNNKNNVNAGSTVLLQTWQESFPMQYSIQNRVMVGVLVECVADAIES